jgi:hypothetical protein
MRISAMQQSKNDHITSDSHQLEDDIFFDKISDEAIERAAGSWSSAAFTMGNCTGLGSCPA